MILPERTLCIHGWGTSPAVWTPFFDQLPVAPDFGAARLPKDLTAVVVDAGNELAAETLIGWSLGGMLALAAIDAIPTVRRCVLIGSAPVFVGRGAWSSAVVNRMRRAYRRDPLAVRETFLARHLPGLSIPEPVDGVEAQDAGLAFLETVDLTDAVARLAIPILWLHGSEDSLFQLPTEAEARKLLPKSQLTYHPYRGLGHAPFLENPGQCRNDLNAFFQYCDS